MYEETSGMEGWFGGRGCAPFSDTHTHAYSPFLRVLWMPCCIRT